MGSWIANQNARREEEENRAFRQRQLHQGRVETEMQEFEGKAAMKRNIREQARVERDRAMEEGVIRAQCEKKLAAEARSQEERLASELERIKHEKLRDNKMRQQIRYDCLKEVFPLTFVFLVKRVMNYENSNRNYVRHMFRKNARLKWPRKKL